MSTAQPANDDREPPWTDLRAVHGPQRDRPATAASTGRRGGTYRIDLTIASSEARVELFGEIDLLSAPDLTRLMDSLDLLGLPICVELGAVTFLDTAGIRPLVDAARRREQHRLPPILIGEASASARYLLNVTHLNGNPRLDVAAWDELLPSGEAWGEAAG